MQFVTPTSHARHTACGYVHTVISHQIGAALMSVQALTHACTVWTINSDVNVALIFDAGNLAVGGVSRDVFHQTHTDKGAAQGQCWTHIMK